MKEKDRKGKRQSERYRECERMRVGERERKEREWERE